MKSLQERFDEKVNKTPTCWLWTAALDRHGYGSIWYRGKKLAHRVSFILAYGREPEGILDHTCMVRECVNPSHLEEVTNAENMARSVLARTHCANGHEHSEENTYRIKGRRYCRACNRERVREYQLRKKALE